jgi:uncharacterized protein YigE (DUF2233 family)
MSLRQLLLVCGCGLVLTLIFVFGQDFVKGESEPSQKPNPIPSPTPEIVKKVGNLFSYGLFRFFPDQKIQLIDNYSSQNSFATIISDYNCVNAINGGFYDTNNLPLGWINVQGKQISHRIKSSLVNGFIYEEKSGKIGIEYEWPGNQVGWGLQTGPILISKGHSVDLKLRSDKPARRSVCVVDKFGMSSWVVVHGASSVFDGPELDKLPDLINEIGKMENIEIYNAINLDGGSASAFKNGAKILNEFNSVGSVICVF